MALIVGIHGIAQQYQSGPQPTGEWLLKIVKLSGVASSKQGAS
jgi:hypothetical protein